MTLKKEGERGDGPYSVFRFFPSVLNLGGLNLFEILPGNMEKFSFLIWQQVILELLGIVCQKKLSLYRLFPNIFVRRAGYLRQAEFKSLNLYQGHHSQGRIGEKGLPQGQK